MVQCATCGRGVTLPAGAEPFNCPGCGRLMPPAAPPCPSCDGRGYLVPPAVSCDESDTTCYRCNGEGVTC